MTQLLGIIIHDFEVLSMFTEEQIASALRDANHRAMSRRVEKGTSDPKAGARSDADLLTIATYEGYILFENAG
jgi:hypothetical protein